VEDPGQHQPSREREGPALALAGRQAGRGGLVPGRARFGISRGVRACVLLLLGACVRGLRGGGWQVDRSHLPSSDGRSLAPLRLLVPPPACRTTALASSTNFHGHVHASLLLPQQYCRPTRAGVCGGPGRGEGVR